MHPGRSRKVPFGDYVDFADCEAKNQDKDDPEAYCAAIKRQIEGKGLKGFLASTMQALSDLIWPRVEEKAIDKPVPPEGQFSIYKDSGGNLRWVGITSNHFRDHDNPPEIIESKAHEEFVSHLDATKEYPPLLIWHTPQAAIR